MRAIGTDIAALGARLVFVGSGTPQHAAWFVEDFDVAEPVFADPARLVYRALGARRGVRSSLDPRVLAHALRAWRRGFRQTATRGDALQQGAVAIVRPGGEVAWRHRSRTAGDHPSPTRVIAAARRALGPPDADGGGGVADEGR